MTNPGQLAAAINGEQTTKTPTLRLRQGTVQAVFKVQLSAPGDPQVETSGYLVDLTLAGDGSVIVPGVNTLSNYVPQVGDSVWVLVNDVDLLVLDKVPAAGASVFSNVVRSYVPGRGSIFTSGNAANPNNVTFGQVGGPSLSVDISESGFFMMGMSAVIEPVADADGAFNEGLVAMSVTITPLENPDGNRPTIVAEMAAALVYQGPVGSQLCASRVHLGAGLYPGPYSFAARWGAGPSFGAMERRELWVLPL